MSNVDVMVRAMVVMLRSTEENMVGLAINVIGGYVMNAKKTQPVKSV